MHTIPAVNLADFRSGGARRDAFVTSVGDALSQVGFFSVLDHAVPDSLLEESYRVARGFFSLPATTKSTYRDPKAAGQRGYTGFGVEHAKDASAPDLKEFWQVGRPDVPPTHPVHAEFGANVWPSEVPAFGPTLTALYQHLDRLGTELLEACALYLGEPPDRFSSMAKESDTIVRVLYYPPTRGHTSGVRSAAHEDINLITLLSAATADGLELLRHDGTWMPVKTDIKGIVVDAGDMMQNVTNGLFRSTTHRVVNPADATTERYSIPCFVHPRRDVDLTPLPSCVARSGGTAKFPSLTAGAYLDQRLREIGLK